LLLSLSSVVPLFSSLFSLILEFESREETASD
jgi:hypothetical protein